MIGNNLTHFKNAIFLFTLSV